MTRPNRPNRRQYLQSAVALGTGLIAGCVDDITGSGGDSDSYRITMQAGSEGSTYYRLSAPLGELVRAQSSNPSIEPTVSTTGGGTQNTRVVGGGDAEFGMAVTASIYSGYHGIGPFDQEWPVRSVARADSYPMFHVVREDSDIEEIADLEGLTGSAGPSGSGSFSIHQAAMDILGIDVNYDRLEHQEGGQALQDGDIDFWWIYVGPHVFRAFSSFDVRPLSFTEEQINKVVEERPWHSILSINSDWIDEVEGEYPNQIGVNPTFFTNENQPDDLIHEMTRILYENADEMNQYRNNPEPLSTEFGYYKGEYDVPYHPGALNYYEENMDDF